MLSLFIKQQKNITSRFCGFSSKTEVPADFESKIKALLDKLGATKDDEQVKITL